MWKILAVLALLVAPSAAHPQNNGAKNQPNSQHTAPTTAISVVDNSCNPAPAQSPSRKSPEAKAGIEWANWALVFVGGLTLIVISVQTRKIALAAEASKVAAQSALTQATYMVASERPWLMIECESNRGVNFWNFSFKVANWGKSPAVVTNHWFQWEPLKSFEEIEHLPPYPKYRTVVTEMDRLVHSEWVAPSKGFELGSFSSFSDSDSLDWNAIFAGTKPLIFKGYVRYMDIFSGDSHVTRFCYLAASQSVTGLKMIGPTPTYNEHT